MLSLAERAGLQYLSDLEGGRGEPLWRDRGPEREMVEASVKGGHGRRFDGNAV